MSAWNRVFRSFTRSALALGLVAFSGGLLAGQIGYLQIDGRVDVQVAGSEQAVRVPGNQYTVFSGDRLMTRSGSTVLVLNAGGAIGLAPSSDALVSLDDVSGDLALELNQGTLLYNLPPRAGQFSVRLGEFELQNLPGDTRAMAVSDDIGELNGMVRRLDDGHIQVAVQSGQIFVTNGNGSRYQVKAGDEIGLLASNRSISRVNVQSGSAELVRIEAPERVGTNEAFRIRWDGDVGPTDSYITIAPKDSDPEAFDRVLSTSEGKVMELEAPGTEGDYEIRFVDGSTGQVTSFVYLQVVGDKIAPWWVSNQQVLGTLALVGGAGAAYLVIDDDDNDGPTSVSP